jgi:hypothetical protein
MTTRTVDLPPEAVFNKPPRDLPQAATSEKSRTFLKNPLSPDQNGVNRYGVSGDNQGSNTLDFTAQTWLWIVVVPVAVWLVIVLLMPSFVKVQAGSDNQLDHGSVLLWTLIISLIIWVLFFGFAKCKSC